MKGNPQRLATWDTICHQCLIVHETLVMTKVLIRKRAREHSLQFAAIHRANFTHISTPFSLPAHRCQQRKVPCSCVWQRQFVLGDFCEVSECAEYQPCPNHREGPSIESSARAAVARAILIDEDPLKCAKCWTSASLCYCARLQSISLNFVSIWVNSTIPIDNNFHGRCTRIIWNSRNNVHQTRGN